MTGIVILAARRTAVVPRGGAFKTLDAATLAAAVIHAVLKDAGVAPEEVDDVILGNALSAGGNVARVAALAAGLPGRVPAATLDTQCCAGLDAIRLGAARILAGEARFVIAGGAESFSRAPLRAHRPTDPSAAPQFYSRPAFTPWPERDPDLTQAAGDLAHRLGLSRTAQEAFARDSHAKALAAPPPACEIVPLAGIDHDPFARMLSPAACARLPALAGEAGFAITAATAAVEADAAAVLLLAAEDAAPAGVPLIRYGGGRAIGGDPAEPAMVPVDAVRQLLAATGTALTDIGHVELMEAYAVQAMATIDALGLNPARVNAHGGALARGHPIGASGAILAVRAVHALRAAGRGRALCAIAGAGGLASAVLFQAGAH